MHIEFKRGSIEDIEFIKSIGKETFYETFKNDNTEQNMQDYLATAFTTEKIMSELKNPYSQFYLLFADAELGVWEKNRNAIDFYIKAGFEECGKHSFYMGDEEQVDWIMKKRL